MSSINGFVRNTHNPDGIYRADMEQYWEKNKDRIFGLYHWLGHKPKTIKEIVSMLEKDDCNFDECKPTAKDVCEWLINEIEFDLIRVENISDSEPF